MVKKISENWQERDPYYRREIEKYGKNPLPSREFILLWLEEQGKLLTFPQIVKAFNMSEARGDLLHYRIKAMIAAGQLMRNRQGFIGVSHKMDLVSGYVIAHPEGYGFLNVEGDIDDGFIPPQYMRELMHGDKILARIKHVDGQGRKDYVPVEILQRGQKRVVGKLLNNQGIFSVIPENRRLTQPIMIPKAALGDAVANQIVLAEITAYPSKHQQAIGTIVKVLGDEMAAGLEVAIAIENYNIPNHFSDAVRAQIEKMPDALQEADYVDRLDLRHLPMVTIDGISARDFDDALYAEKRGENYRLFVAIADVSYYVKPDSPLDEEAYARGTSVYFPDRVVPMLPEKLSNGLCSLNPHVDRLCLVCELTITPSGQIKNSKFHQAVIQSHARLTYETVEKILFLQDPLMQESFAQLRAPLEDLRAVYQILRTAREKRQAIRFDFKEAEFLFDSEGKIESIQARKELESYQLIEECMVIANVAAAKFLQKHKLIGLYRVHDKPSAERFEKVFNYFAKLGFKTPSFDTVTVEHFAHLLKKAEGRQDRALLEKMILRSLPQALYSSENRGHFALALSHYAHFTSPIRRYPDLLVHRAIRHCLQEESSEVSLYSLEKMDEMAKHCSMTERRADDASRDAMDFLKCEFMSHRIGDEFFGEISSVTSFGLFITLDEFFIDGLVHVSTLPSDYYHYDADNVRLLGERSGHSYQLMDKVRIRVVQVNIEDKKIDFELLEHQGKKLNKKKRTRTDKRGRARKGKL